MKIITIQTGDMFVNCYIVFNEGVNEAVVIDPGGSAEKILYQIDKNGLRVTHILLTHGHFDHIGGVEELKQKTGAKVCIHKDDAPLLADPARNLSVFIDSPFTVPAADILLEDKDLIKTGGMDIEVMHTPGHSEGSVCFIADDALFSGDTLFCMSVGRTDFPGSDTEKLMYSVNVKLGGLQKDYKVYPGHGNPTTLFMEKKQNPFFRR